MAMRTTIATVLLPALALLPGSPVLGQASSLDPDAIYTSSPELAPLPEGGFVAIWHRDRSEFLGFGPDDCITTSLVGGFLDDAGELVAPPREILLPGGGFGRSPRLAATLAGDLALAWVGPSGLQVGRLTRDLAVPSSTPLSHCELRSLELVAAGDSFWAVWSEACDTFRVRARRLDRRARPVGAAIEVADPTRQPGAGIAAAGGEDGGVSVAWVESVSEIGRRVLWSRYREDGRQVATPYPVSPGADSPGRELAAAALPDGGVAFAWREESGRILVRRFDPDGAPAGAIRQAGVQAGERERAPRLAVTPAGLLVVAWARSLVDPPPGCPVRVFDLDLEPLTGEIALAEPCDHPVSLAVSATGALLASWVTYPDLALNVCSRAQVIVPGLEVLPPPVPPFLSPEYPDFRFWVRIGGDEPEPRIGSPEPLCLPETVCVSGALAGRTEVFLRIAGPKPNGFLWPTLVRFTTSTVEVWIEQVSTGIGRYYRLEGAAPGSDTLDGRFDRTGFPP